MANIELDGANKKIKVDSGDLTLDVPGDIVLDADGGDVVFADGGTNLLKVTNSSSDVVLQPQVDTKDIVFKQYDGTVVATVEDNATFNIPASKLAIGGTAVTSTAAELNILDGVTATATELNLIDGVTATTAELNILDGVTATAAEINLIDGGTARGTTAIADGDGVLINDAGTMRMTTVQTLKTYIDAESNDHYFFARGDGTQTISNNTDTTCEFDVIVDSLDSHSGYNTSTYTYTVQTGGAGLWYLKFGNYFNGANSWGGGEQIQMQLYGAGMNNHLYIDGSSGGNRTDGWLEVNSLVKLAVGDTVKGVVWQNTGGNVTANNNNGNAILGGFRVKAI
jgi:hypothetical protein